MMNFPHSLEQQFEVLEPVTLGKVLTCFHVKERRFLGKERMLRFLPPRLSGQRRAVEEFHGFFERFSEISNQKHVAKVFSVAGDTGGDVYVVEEYSEGVTLPQYSLENRGSEGYRENIVKVLSKVCEALHYAHQKEIFHLCIRPGDIRIANNNPNKVKLLGFEVQAFAKGFIAEVPSISRSYVDPEVLEGKSFGPRSDIYSLAKVIREHLTSSGIDMSVIDRACSRDPEKRFSSAREFASKLGELTDTRLGLGRWLFRTRMPWKTDDEASSGVPLTLFTLPPRVSVKNDGKLIGVTGSSGLNLSWKPGYLITLEKDGYQTKTLSLTEAPKQGRMTVRLESNARALDTPLELKTRQDTRTRSIHTAPASVNQSGHPKSVGPQNVTVGATKRLPTFRSRVVAALIFIPLLVGIVAGSTFYFLYGRSQKSAQQLPSPSVTQPTAQQKRTVSRRSHSIPIPPEVKNPRARSLVFNSNTKMSDVIEMADFVLQLTNEERTRQGLDPLRSSAVLAFLAQVHSENMCESRVQEHESSSFPQGWKGFKERLKLFDIGSGAENIATINLDRPEKWARQLVGTWMNSQDHKQNLLDPRWRYIGIGVCPCSGGMVYAAQLFSDEEGVLR